MNGPDGPTTFDPVLGLGFLANSVLGLGFLDNSVLVLVGPVRVFVE